uniref:hypothetical protein n=1 Tax=Algoriphagus sp. TaxID=1872435 RepID=UPI004047C430
MFTFFMVALDHTHTAQLVKFLLKYINDDAEYIVGLETCETAHKETNGQHFHFAVEMEEKQYDNFRKSILVNHYKLRGRATKNLPRQYGKCKEVRDIDKFLAYTCKDQNIVTNIDDKKRIDAYIQESYKREEKKAQINTILDYLGEIPMPNNDHLEQCITEKYEIAVLDWYRKNTDKVPAISTLKHIVSRFLLFRQNHST